MKQRWFQLPTIIRKPLVFIVGSVVIVAGIIMLVFPGPGWAAIFLGFAILATEFYYAEKIRDFLIQIVKRMITVAKQELQKPWLLP